MKKTEWWITTNEEQKWNEKQQQQIEKPWFQRVPLTMQQMASQILNDGYMQLGAPTISITFDVLDFLRYEEPAVNRKQNFEKLLGRWDIPFRQVKYDDPGADKHIKQDGLHIYNWRHKGPIKCRGDFLRVTTKIMAFSAIFQFIRDHKLPIVKDIEKPWFQRVWMPLTMRQMSSQILSDGY